MRCSRSLVKTPLPLPEKPRVEEGIPMALRYMNANKEM
jgi:hypothetical protein